MRRTGVLLCVVFLGLGLGLGGCARPGATGAPGGAGTDPGWPAVVAAPARQAPALPTSRAVGRGQLISRCGDCPHWTLRLADGTEFTLPADADRVTSREDGTTAGGRLSLDGRWLALRPLSPDGLGTTGWAFRDLLGTTVRTVPGREMFAWSANGRWVVLCDDAWRMRRLDLTTGATLAVRGGGWPVGVLDTGDVLLAAPAVNPFQLPSISPRPSPAAGARAGAVAVTVVRPGSDVSRRVELEVWPVLTAAQQHSEGTRWSEWAVPADGAEIVGVGTSDVPPTRFVARFSLTDGHLLGIVKNLPDPGYATLLGRYAPDGGLLFVRHDAGGQDLLRVDPAGTGPAEVRCHAPGDFQIDWRVTESDRS
jgi:hypothetical protein